MSFYLKNLFFWIKYELQTYKNFKYIFYIKRKISKNLDLRLKNCHGSIGNKNKCVEFIKMLQNIICPATIIILWYSLQKYGKKSADNPEKSRKISRCSGNSF